jgi:ribosomal protein S27E
MGVSTVECLDCGNSNTLVWRSGTRVLGNVSNGKLSSHDIEVVFHLECQSCSNTVKTCSGELVAELLTQITLNKDGAA